MKNYQIAVAGTGYVGLSIATLLAQHHPVTAVDVIPEKVEKINRRISPIQAEYIEKYLAEKELNLKATLDGASAYRDADFIVIAAPTNYDPVKNYFDTSHVEEVIDLVLEVNPDAVMVIKSTFPVGYCRSLYVKYAPKFENTPALQGKKFNLLFSPEFLRESKALYDNLYPSRIIVGTVIFAIPCIVMTAGSIGSAPAGVQDGYGVTETTRELAAVLPGFKDYTVAVETSATEGEEEGIVEREIVAHVTTGEALGAHDRRVARKLIDLHVPALDRVEFDVE